MSQLENTSKEVSLIFVHSNECTRDYIASDATHLNKGIVNVYSGPDELLNNAYRYPKHTKIVVGRRFKEEAEYGIKIAEQLHALGFTRLYLFSVSSLSEEGVPNYVKVIKRHDLNWLESILME